MTEGYYEEPMKWTLRSNDSVYENERREVSDNRKRSETKVKRFCRYYAFPNIANATVLLAVIGSAVISLICLIVLVQASNSSDKDLSTIRQLLYDLKKNSTAQMQTPMTQETSTEPKANETETCQNTYKGKCFRLVGWTSNLTLAESREACHKIEGILANIYDWTHFVQITTLLKNSLAPGQQETSAWTGMTVDTKSRKMIFTNFTLPEQPLPWYPGRLFSHKLPYLAVKVSQRPNLYARGMYDTRSTERFQTAICEISKRPCLQ